MHFASNVTEHGGDFLNIIENSFSKSQNVTIAVGYIGSSVVEKFSSQLLRIAKDGGSAKLLIGMAFYEGLKGNQDKILNKLNDKLSKININNGIYVSTGGRYHGKIYCFDIENSKKYFVGSSNFSTQGLRTNKEFNILINNDKREDIQSYLDHLFEPDNAKKINKAEIGSVKTKKIKIKTDYKSLVSRLERYDSNTYNAEDLELAFSFPLSVSATKERSHLNTYFGKGRIGAHGITPRPWYEVQLITPVKIIRSNEGYPKGNFLAYTDDGYIIPMHTSGDYYKNIESSGKEKGALQLFGAWIKGKLQKSGALEMFTPFDLDVLANYGNDKLNFYKIEDSSIGINKYYLEF